MECRHEKALKFALQQLKGTFNQYILGIYLYGSYARGEQKYNSDVDLFVYVRPDTPTTIMAKMKSSVISDDYTLPDVELKISKTDFNDFNDRFSINLRRDARLLWKAP